MRVADHYEPVAKLRRVLEMANRPLPPFMQGMPKRYGTSSALSNSVMQMLRKPPASPVVG